MYFSQQNQREQVTSINMLKITMIIAGVFLLLYSENLLACHESDFDGEELLVGTSFFGGHTGDNKMGRAVSVKENFIMLTGNITEATTITSNYTIDTFATTTNCNWRTANIQKFFNDSLQQIAEESAQGSGQHLEALASLSGCSAEQYGTFAAAMNRNHRYVFAGKDYDGSVNNFFNVLNTDEDLLNCWGQS